MKFPLIATILCAASAAAFAQEPQQTLDQVRVPASQGIFMPAHTASMADIDFGLYQGAYDLANGQTLWLTSRGRHMYAQVGDSEPREVAATTRGTFIAFDKTLKVSLERTGQGDFSGELLMVKTPQVAGQPVETISLAIR